MMTDLEISKALALAIGWKETDFLYSNKPVKHSGLSIYCNPDNKNWFQRSFDYRDWNVIGPIAEKFDCFPYKCIDSWYTGCASQSANTPQKAIALAVIGAKK